MNNFRSFIHFDATMRMSLASILLREKPTRVLILLRDKTKRWYVSALAKQVDTTYPYMVALIKKLEQFGVVRTVKQGRTRYVELTEVGEELAHDLEGLYRHMQQIEKTKKN